MNLDPVLTLTALDEEEKEELRTKLIWAMNDFFDQLLEQGDIYAGAKADRYGNALVRAIDKALNEA